MTDLQTADSSAPPSSRRRLDLAPGAAVVTFGAVLVVALALYLWAGQTQWFFLDEWDFLAARSLSPGELLRPHNEHWTALPIASYRVLWQAFGLNVYWPYQLVAIVSHLAVAGLLRAVMRRAGVGPWIATIIASVFALYGAGAQNILWGFQITFTWPLAFGLTHLLLSDHEGRIDRRDWLGLAAGLAAIMSSGVGVTMVVAVGIAVLLRRGVRAALFHTVPLGAIYLLWYLAYGKDARLPSSSTARQTASFVAEGMRSTLRTLGSAPGVGVLLAVVLVLGLVLAWHRLDRADVRARAAGPAGLLIGAVIALALAGYNRAWVFGSDYAASGRFIHVTAALLLPALAVSVDAIYRRWPPVGYVCLVVVLVGVPGNVLLTTRYDTESRVTLGQPQVFLATAQLARADGALREVEPFPDIGRGITVGWMVDALDQGKVPAPPDPLSAEDRAIGALRLGLLQSDRPVEAGNCAPLRTERRVQLGTNESFSMRGGQVRVRLADHPGVRTAFNPAEGSTITAVADPMDLILSSTNTAYPPQICE
jgi:hypothetical protein